MTYSVRTLLLAAVVFMASWATLPTVGGQGKGPAAVKHAKSMQLITGSNPACTFCIDFKNQYVLVCTSTYQYVLNRYKYVQVWFCMYCYIPVIFGTNKYVAVYSSIKEYVLVLWYEPIHTKINDFVVISVPAVPSFFLESCITECAFAHCVHTCAHCTHCAHCAHQMHTCRGTPLDQKYVFECFSYWFSCASCMHC